MSTNHAEIARFAKIFGVHTPFTIDITIQAIRDIQDEYYSVIAELEDALEKYKDEEKRKRAITIQIEKTQREGLLKYLSEKQFIPNASMPTGVVSFDFIDREQSRQLADCYKRSKELNGNGQIATQRLLIQNLRKRFYETNLTNSRRKSRRYKEEPLQVVKCIQHLTSMHQSKR